jgi:hypothetical protein
MVKEMFGFGLQENVELKGLKIAGSGTEKVGSVIYGLCVFCVLSASGVSLFTIWSHLKNYRRPDLQRLSIRIILMYVCQPALSRRKNND